jgi:plastocyanin domain-containing protein
MKRSTLVVIAALVASCDKAPAPSAAPVSSAPVTVAPEGGAVAITADEKGFSPTEVNATEGAPLTLVFTRTSDNTCAKEVVFPELKLRRPLPLNQAVAVAMPTQVARTYKFQCGMAMWEGSVVIKGAAK